MVGTLGNSPPHLSKRTSGLLNDLSGLIFQLLASNKSPLNDNKDQKSHYDELNFYNLQLSIFVKKFR